MSDAALPAREPEPVDAAPPMRAPGAPRAPSTWWLTRMAVVRALGFIYAVAFAIAVRQYAPLFGEHGLIPAVRELAKIRAAVASPWEAFLDHPTLFWLDA